MKTSLSSSHPAVKCLLCEVAERYSMPLNAPKEYDKLSEDILLRTRQHLNGDTLRRLFGYRSDTYSSIRHSTLDILASYIGMADWQAFTEHLRKSGGVESELTHYDKSVRAANMKEGQLCEIAWQPDRVCLLKYLGNRRWEVVNVENSHTLQAGDKFYCGMFVQGETAFFDRLTRQGIEQGGVKVGTDNGLTCVKVCE